MVSPYAVRASSLPMMPVKHQCHDDNELAYSTPWLLPNRGKCILLLGGCQASIYFEPSTFETLKPPVAFWKNQLNGIKIKSTSLLIAPMRNDNPLRMN